MYINKLYKDLKFNNEFKKQFLQQVLELPTNEINLTQFKFTYIKSLDALMISYKDEVRKHGIIENLNATFSDFQVKEYSIDNVNFFLPSTEKLFWKFMDKNYAGYKEDCLASVANEPEQNKPFKRAKVEQIFGI